MQLIIAPEACSNGLYRQAFPEGVVWRPGVGGDVSLEMAVPVTGLAGPSGYELPNACSGRLKDAAW